jgi:hypothetical protein
MHKELRAQGAADGAQQAAHGGQGRIAWADETVIWASGRDSAGTRK